MSKVIGYSQVKAMQARVLSHQVNGGRMSVDPTT
jgi:hypothetical protein